MKKIEKMTQYAMEKLTSEITAHDFSHSYRVMKIAKHIASGMDIDLDMEVVEAAAITHDIIDKKVAMDTDIAIKDLERELLSVYSERQAQHVLDIIQNMSYSSHRTPESMEGKIVQDADRLEAVGAIAIARVFAYGGKLNRIIYEEGQQNCSIAHFYEKLLRLKDMMNTEVARDIAISRHQYMEGYLEQFLKEFHLQDIQ